MIRLVLRAALLEWLHIARRGAAWLLTACFGLLALAACLFEGLRQSYFSAAPSLPLFLLGLAAPPFLALGLAAALCPVFAGREERQVAGLADACRLGRAGGVLAKLLGALWFGGGLCLLYGLLCAGLPALFGLYNGSLPVACLGDDLVLHPVWAVWRHLAFALCSLGCGCALLALLALCFSRRASGPGAAAAGCAVVLLLEVLFQRFSFPVFLREYNLWMLFTPYSLFGSTLYPLPPWQNLLLVMLAFLPAILALLWLLFCPQEG